MVNEVCERLIHNPDGRYLDATVGGGGHAKAILAKLSERGRLYGTDPDPSQIARARGRIGSDPRLTLIRGWADESGPVLESMQALPLDGVLADFGLSRDQVDDPSRGFSFRFGEAGLDMRFDPDGPVNAADLLKDADLEGLREMLAEGGAGEKTESLARRLAAAGPVRSAGELAALAGSRRGRLHPATLLFQALRMRVNRELERIRHFLDQLPSWLRPGGRAAILSYHSLEDRLVKAALRGGVPGLRADPRKSIKPSREECRANPPSRSAKLRIAVREAA